MAQTLQIKLDGKLDALIGGGHYPAMNLQGGLVVAEEGFEPPTRGL